jgi:hypothetical protein
MSIYKKLNDFKSKVGGIKKDGTNPHFKNKYATIESVLDTVESPLNQSGLGFVQCVNGMELVTTIYDTESDERIESKIPLLLNKQDMQQLGSAITYARRYALVSMLGLEQEDDDGNYASGNSHNQQIKQQEVQKPAVKVVERINESQVLELESLFTSNEHKQDFLTTCKITKLNELPMSWFSKAVENLKK